MKKVIFILFLLSSFTKAATGVTVSNRSELPADPTDYVGVFFGGVVLGDTIPVVGQFFEAPDALNTRLSDFSFLMRNAEGLGTFSFDFIIAEWSETLAKPLVEIFREKQQWVSPIDARHLEVGLEGGAVDLAAGQKYVALLDGSPYVDESVFDGTSAIFNMFVPAVGGGSYADGALVASFETDSSRVIDGDSMIQLDTYDFAFSATFVDPDATPEAVPNSGSTLVMFAFSMMLLIGGKRRLF